MRGIFLTFVLVTSLLAAGPAARQKPQDVAFQAAQRTETVGGDLKGAIKQYEQIVATYGKTDRAIAAKALLRMAEAYQKLGAADARKLYERIVREYADQKTIAATARERLGSTTALPSTGDRVVWSGEDVPNAFAVSPDGRHLAYCDGTTANVMLRSVETGDVRALTNGGSWEKSEFCETMAFSRDGKHLAYAWFTGGETTKLQLRVMPVTHSGYPDSRVVVEYSADHYFEIFDWAADGRVLAQHERGRTNEIVFIRDNGTRDVVKILGLRGALHMRVSPDGRRVAFDAPASDQSAQHDVFVIGSDGSGETPVATGPSHDVVAGWSPDGRRVLFMTDAGGATSHLMAQAIDTPRAKGDVLRRNVRGEIYGISTSGAAYLYASTSDEAIHTAAVDIATGKLLAPPNVAVPAFWPRSRQPKWSRDGKAFAALASSRSNGTGPPVLMVHANDHTRFVPLKVAGIWTWDWSADGRSLLARATDLDRRHGLFLIDTQTGAASPVLLNNPPAHPQTREFTSAPVAGRVAHFMPQWSATPGKFVYNRGGATPGMYERDLKSGEERLVLVPKALRTADGTPFPGMRDQTVSPDGKYLAGFTPQPETILWVVTLADQTAREVFRVKRRNGFAANDGLAWTPDSKALVVNVNPDEFGTPAYKGKGHGLWAVHVADARAVKLDIGLSNLRPAAIAVHPDGRHVAFVAGDWSMGEIRMLESVVPKAPAKRGSQ